jgi:hypothetical protein
MSLDHYSDARRRISSIQHNLDQNIESLRRNPSLSTQGRRAEMAKATLDAQQMVARVRNEIVGARKAEHDRLTKHLFGMSPDEGGVLAARDAADRAAKIEGPEAASAALKRAQLVSDKSMQRAVAHLAVAKGWDDVLGVYVDGLPAAESTPTALSLQKLSAIPAGPLTDAADGAVFRVRPPNELSSYREGDLEQIARDAAPAQS